MQITAVLTNIHTVKTQAMELLMLRRYVSEVDLALEPQRLSLAKLHMLQALVKEGQPLPLGQLAERLSCVKSNVTQLVDRLEADGLVQRTSDPDDRRSKQAVITDEGRRRLKLGQTIKQKVNKQLLRELSAAEQEQLASVLRKLGSSAAR